MTFYQLTDPIRRGDVIRAEGRKHYTYSFGACRWVRTAALMAYLDEESPLYGQYEQIDEQTALELVLAKNRALLQQQTAAEARMQHLCGERCDELGIRWADRLRQEAEALPDLEQKITALLQKELAFGGTVQALHEAGFHPRIVRAVRLLTQTPGTDFYAYIRGLRRDEISRAVKTEDLNWLVDRKRLTQGAPLPEQTRTQALAALRYLAMEGELPGAHRRTVHLSPHWMRASSRRAPRCRGEKRRTVSPTPSCAQRRAAFSWHILCTCIKRRTLTAGCSRARSFGCLQT